ncbi:HPP family protein [Corynebacterium ulceribovis]|uniref:HPP family protein n=1 Tax=Corynebacterium ulceribovis TaxID=487732 RepID=UPI00036F8597
MSEQSHNKHSAEHADEFDFTLHGHHSQEPRKRDSGLKRLESHAPPRPPVKSTLVMTLAVTTCLLAVTGIGLFAEYPLLLPSLAASTGLILGAPDTPLGQPRNVILGHTVSAVIGLALGLMFGAHPVAAAVAAGLAFGAMLLFRAAHTPGVATALVACLTGPEEPATFMVMLLFASLVLIAMGWLWHKALHTHYPVYWW